MPFSFPPPSPQIWRPRPLGTLPNWPNFGTYFFPETQSGSRMFNAPPICNCLKLSGFGVTLVKIQCVIVLRSVDLWVRNCASPNSWHVQPQACDARNSLPINIPFSVEHPWATATIFTYRGGVVFRAVSWSIGRSLGINMRQPARQQIPRGSGYHNSQREQDDCNPLRRPEQKASRRPPRPTSIEASQMRKRSIINERRGGGCRMMNQKSISSIKNLEQLNFTQ